MNRVHAFNVLHTSILDGCLWFLNYRFRGFGGRNGKGWGKSLGREEWI